MGNDRIIYLKQKDMKKENNSLKFDFKDGTLYVSLMGEMGHHSAVKLRNDVDAEIYSRKPKKL